MFDDPKKELKRLEEELLAAEKSDEAFEQFYSEIYDEFGEKESSEDTELKNLLEDTPVRNYSNNYGRGTPKRPVQADNTPRSSAGRNTYADSSRYAAPVKKDNSIRNLMIAICVECLGIAAVILWWMLRIL